MTVDEIMVAYKGRYCNVQQYMKAKPTKFGIKLWALVSAQSRYIHNAIIYLGSGDDRDEGESVNEGVVLTSVGARIFIFFALDFKLVLKPEV
jgi:hypothetical protein